MVELRRRVLFTSQLPPEQLPPAGITPPYRCFRQAGVSTCTPHKPLMVPPGSHCLSLKIDETKKALALKPELCKCDPAGIADTHVPAHPPPRTPVDCLHTCLHQSTSVSNRLPFVRIPAGRTHQYVWPQTKKAWAICSSFYVIPLGALFMK